MTRRITRVSLLAMCLAASSADLLAQSSSFDPHVRRANREKAVAIVGPEGREFVETYGEDAVAAISACSKPVAVKLVEFHVSGRLSKVARPGDLLRLIAKPRHGDDVALWAMLHADELADTDFFNAFLARPLEYALGLQKLEAGAATARANRLNPPEEPTKPWASLTSVLNDDRVGMAACACFVILLGIALWRRRHSSMYS